jgi:hypothetical protein
MSATDLSSRSDLPLTIYDFLSETSGGFQARKKPRLFPQNLTLKEVI